MDNIPIAFPFCSKNEQRKSMEQGHRGGLKRDRSEDDRDETKESINRNVVARGEDGELAAASVIYLDKQRTMGW